MPVISWLTRYLVCDLTSLERKVEQVCDFSLALANWAFLKNKLVKFNKFCCRLGLFLYFCNYTFHFQLKPIDGLRFSECGPDVIEFSMGVVSVSVSVNLMVNISVVVIC